MPTTDNDLRWMQQALKLAKRGEGLVEPNPMVGCVIVKNNVKIGQGYHKRFGTPHAEPNALNSCNTSPRGATAYVTLEPCCHHGKTPPCTDALIAAKVKRVVVAMADPFAKVAGHGLATLREHGITVDVGLCEQQAKQLNEPYLKRLATGMPWVIAKWAQTLDGYIATHTGSSKWISNAQSRQHVHELRARMDAVIVGITTAITDNATLTARDVPLKRIATRIVIDPSLKLPVTSNLVKTIDQAPLMVVCSTGMAHSVQAKRLSQCGVELIHLKPDRDGRLNLTRMLKQLVTIKQMSNVLVEGGAMLHGQMFKRRLVDQLLAFVAPKLLGDPTALSPLHTGKQCNTITQGMTLSLRNTVHFDEDVMLDYRVNNRVASDVAN